GATAQAPKNQMRGADIHVVVRSARDKFARCPGAKVLLGAAGLTFIGHGAHIDRPEAPRLPAYPRPRGLWRARTKSGAKACLVRLATCWTVSLGGRECSNSSARWVHSRNQNTTGSS